MFGCINDRVTDSIVQFVQGLDRVAKKRSVVLLHEAKESIDMTKELLIVVATEAMMIVMATAPSSKSKRNHILRCPREVILVRKKA